MTMEDLRLAKGGGGGEEVLGIALAVTSFQPSLVASLLAWTHLNLTPGILIGLVGVEKQLLGYGAGKYIIIDVIDYD